MPCCVRDYTAQTPEPIIKTVPEARPGGTMTGLHWTSAFRTEVIHPTIEGTGYALERHKRGKIFFLRLRAHGADVWFLSLGKRAKATLARGRGDAEEKRTPNAMRTDTPVEYPARVSINLAWPRQLSAPAQPILTLPVITCLTPRVNIQDQVARKCCPQIPRLQSAIHCVRSSRKESAGTWRGLHRLEDRLATIASAHDVGECAGELDAGWRAMGETCARSKSVKNC